MSLISQEFVVVKDKAVYFASDDCQVRSIWNPKPNFLNIYSSSCERYIDGEKY